MSLITGKISGIGGAVGGRCIKNSDLEKILDTTDEWITQRTGISQRYWVEADKATSDLGLEATLKALDHAKLKASDIDLIIFATSSPDHDIPGSAAFLQAKLGLSGIPYFDIRQACSGFIYSLSLAETYIQSGKYECILIVAAEVQSKGLDLTPNGRTVSVIFGDGAGAAIITRTEVLDKTKDAHIMTTHLHADGAYAKELWMPAPGSGMNSDARINVAMLNEGAQYPQMNGKLVFTHAVTRMPEVVKVACSSVSLTPQDLDLYFFHQANMRINSKVAELLSLPESKLHTTIHKYGNTTAATIPLGMFDAMNEGKLNSGMLLGMASFGAGFTWASAIVRF